MKVLAILSGLLITSTLLAETPVPVPPAAPKVEHKEIRHGATVVDNYYWLRERSNPSVTKYLEAENAYTEAMTSSLNPLKEKLYSEMLGRINQTDLTVPVRDRNYFYYSRTEEGKQYPIYCRKKESLSAPEEVLLDLNQLGEGRKFVSVTDMAVSDDQNMLAYLMDYVGFRQYTLRIKDLRSGETLPETAERATSAEWMADNKTVVFTTEDEVTKRSDKLWRHTLGSAQNEPLYTEKDELYDISVGKTHDRKYLFLQIESKDTTEVRYLRANEPEGSFAVFLPRKKDHRYYLEHRDDLFYLRTNREGKKNFEIVTAPDTAPDPKNWKVFLPYRDNVLLQSLDVFHHFAVSTETSNALNRLRVYNFDSGQWSDIAFPEPVYTAHPGSNREYESTTFRYQYESFITPNSVYDYDTRTSQSTLLKQQKVLGGYDPSQYTSERLWATARDGVRVPISIVYKKGFRHDGSAPLLLYGYGSYGIGMPANFDSTRFSLIDRGMAYAIAHIRGGNEMGEHWREDGMLMKKKNTFNDFVDCAQHLVDNKWTSRDKLVIEGGSAGGLLMGAVVNQRPDLFRAVHLAVPFVDVMNTMMDATLPLTVGEYLEWGNPNELAAYNYMKTYSPYDNLEKRAYPAMLVTTSLHDSQVMYWEPAKYVARLRTLKDDNTPLLLKIKMEPAGHGGASGRYDRLRDKAFEYAWFLSQLGITN